MCTVNKSIVAAFLSLGLLFGCSNKTKQKDQSVTKTDSVVVKKKNELTILTMNSSTSYFIYKDEPMGYNYDLARDFCKKNHLKLIVKTAPTIPDLIQMLKDGKGDVIAYQLPVSQKLKDSLLYSGPRQITHQVLVQKRIRYPSQKEKPITDVTQLIGKTVYVLAQSKYEQRANNLNNELGGGVNIKVIKDSTISIEDMIEKVSKGKIKYILCDEYIAKLNNTYFKNLDISLSVSLDQQTSWAVLSKNKDLAAALNNWVANNYKQPFYSSITKKYFELSKQPDYQTLSSRGPTFIQKTKGIISPYDNLFKKYAQNFGYSWYVLAAISYQESRFKNHLTSWAGASGIMGLMPNTAKIYGISNNDRMNPELSIKVSVSLLNKLNSMFGKIQDPHERLKFMLASYNCGVGHIIDAQKLAKKYGANPYIWEGNVRKYFELKRLPEYYNDPVCKNGYCRGKETLRYVDDILANAAQFKSLMIKS